MSALPEFPSSEILIEVFQICTLIAERKAEIIVILFLCFNHNGFGY